MTPVEATPAQVLAAFPDHGVRRVTMVGPEGSSVSPCPTVVTSGDDGAEVVRVAWALDAAELDALVKGGMLWLSTWGGLPPHNLRVVPAGS